jgi:polysaccharide export outer membrane protein
MANLGSMADTRSHLAPDARWRRRGVGLIPAAAYVAIALAGVLPAQAQDGPRAAPMIDAGTANLPLQRIGSNDLIAISVYNSPEFTRTLRVGTDGFIRIPMLSEPVKAEGRMPGELEGIIAKALQSAQLIVDPLVTVTVVEYKSRPISVMGAVRKPTTFQAAGQLTLLEALARAEGLAADAGPEILVTQMGAAASSGNSLVRRIPVKALLSASDPALNMKLMGGEEIRIPRADNIFIVGNVKKPGAFAVGEETGTTVMKAVALAEGLMPFASKQAVIYRREAAGSVNELPLDLGKIMDRKAPDTALLPNDVLYIPEAKGRRLGWATVERLLLFGSGAATAMIYGAAVH